MVEVCVIVNNRLLIDVFSDLEVFILFILLMLLIMKIKYDVEFFFLFGFKDVLKFIWKCV